MSIKRQIGLIWARHRKRAIERISRRAGMLQAKTFRHLITQGRKTEFGRAHRFDQIHSFADFQAQVPVRDYEQARDWFQQIYEGKPDVSWPGKPLYLAKTSGTTSGAKYIPITKASIRKQILGARDSLMCYMAEKGQAHFLDGKMMFLSGSPEIEENKYGLKVGRLSGIVNHFVPQYLQTNKVPDYETNIIEDWEEKVTQIVQEVKDQDLRLISGIPPWVQMLFEELEAQTGKAPQSVWPKLELFIQGGVDFSAYQPIFEKYFDERVSIMEVYPASEGFFALQDRVGEDGMLLMPNYGIFYEFIPLAEYGRENAPRLTLQEVEPGQQYALVISTNAGLWAYDIGDTVKFLSVDPYRIKVSGRVKHFISAFGEHVISEEVNRAILTASEATGARFQEFTVAPLIREEKGQSAHEWLIEFVKEPRDLEHFAQVLDESLRQQNSYYDDLRAGQILQRARVRCLQPEATRTYMKAIGKLGGQNKFPRLSNDRKIADQLYAFLR